MRRVSLFAISWLLILVASTGGGVWAAERLSDESCIPEIPAKAAGLAPAQEEPLAVGQILALDAKAGRVTIVHRGVEHLYIQPGTSVFRVKNPAVLAGFSPGDKVRFDIVRDGKRFAVTHLENSN